MNIPLTETEIVVRVAAHPLIKGYSKALAKLHAQHTENYGADFMEPEIINENTNKSETPRGVKRWTPQEEVTFHNLYAAAQKMRQNVRETITRSK